MKTQALALAAALLVPACGVFAQGMGGGASKDSAKPHEVLLEGLGTYHFAVSTTSGDAQKFFDQGLRLIYAFNLEEAQRSFEEAAAMDPGCAMAYWGVALSLGPNINLPAMP